MGSPESEHGRKADESPQTTVTLTKGYWLANTEVTVGQWKAVTGQSLRDKVNKLLNDETLYDFDGKKLKERDFMHFDKNDPGKIMANADDNLPMYFVSWNEAEFLPQINRTGTRPWQITGRLRIQPANGSPMGIRLPCRHNRANLQRCQPR